MRRAFVSGLLVLAVVIGPVSAACIWFALWANDYALSWPFGATTLAWFALPAATTGLLCVPVIQRNGKAVGFAAATSGVVGLFLTYIALMLSFADAMA
jgi:hypothetical protein